MNIFNDAIENHAVWKMNLKRTLEEGIFQDIKQIGDCHACGLGRWIYSDGVRYNHLPSFDSMCVAHEHFHRTAAEVIYYGNKNNLAKARGLLTVDGAFFQSSTKLIRALMDCSNELADSVVTGIRSREKVKDLLRNKDNQAVQSIDAGATAMDAIKLMVDHNIGSIVINKDSNFLGIFTERSYMQHLVYKGECCLKMPVSDMIDVGTICIDLEDSIEQCLLLMTTSHIRHLPVLEHGRLVGILSIGDVVKKVMTDDSDTISQLDQYVHNCYGAS